MFVPGSKEKNSNTRMDESLTGRKKIWHEIASQQNNMTMQRTFIKSAQGGEGGLVMSDRTRRTMRTRRTRRTRRRR